MIKRPYQPLALAKKSLPQEIMEAYQKASKRLFLFDYDGTLVKFASAPGRAKPTVSLMKFLTSLSADSRNSIVIISGRDKHTLGSWLGNLPIGMSAEHGAFRKEETGWQATFEYSGQWKDSIKPIFNSAVLSLPGSKIEEKETAIVFHYRTATNLKIAEKETNLMVRKLLVAINSLSLEVRHDTREMVVEVKQSGTNKSLAALDWLGRYRYDFILCAGDSTSDEAMFKVLPKDAISIKVGPDKTIAKFRISDPNSLVESLIYLSKSS